MGLLNAEQYRKLREREEEERKKRPFFDGPDALDKMCDAVERYPIGRISHRFGIRDKQKG